MAPYPDPHRLSGFASALYSGPTDVTLAPYPDPTDFLVLRWHFYAGPTDFTLALYPDPTNFSFTPTPPISRLQASGCAPVLPTLWIGPSLSDIQKASRAPAPPLERITCGLHPAM